VPFSRSISCSIEQGDNIDLSAITTTVHVGAHTDAPNHYQRGGQDIASRELDRYYGPCQVIEVSVGRHERIVPSHVGVAITAPRVLFKTGTFPDPNHFSTDFASLSAELVGWLADRGVVLVGIDTPSIDLFEDKQLQSHTAVAQADMGILEGIVLARVQPGTYVLIALPLKIEGADASPVRAALAPA